MRDQRFLAFLHTAPDFLGQLTELQKRVLGNCLRYDLLLRPFWLTVSLDQLRKLEGAIVEGRVQEAEREEMLMEVAR